MGRCERGVSHRVFLLVCGASAARAHSRGSGSGGRFCFLGREGAGRVVRVQEPYRGRARFFQKLTFYIVTRPKLMFFMQNFKGFPMP